MEEDEDVKRVNRIILEAQCQATYEIPICEKKKEIKAEMAKEREVSRRNDWEGLLQSRKTRKINEPHEQKLKNRMLQFAHKFGSIRKISNDDLGKQQTQDSQEKIRL